MEYQWIGAGLMPGAREYVPCLGFGKAGPVDGLVDRLAHCWVLRQQGCVPVRAFGSGPVGGCGLFLFVPAQAGSTGYGLLSFGTVKPCGCGGV